MVVGAESCARTLIEHGCPPEKIKVVNYGYDPHLFKMERPTRIIDPRKPINFLFAGEIGPRKGAAYLLQAIANLPEDQFKLTLVGNLAIPETTFKRFSKRVTHHPQVARSKMPAFFKEADCFIFPSLFEGSALVLYEAIASGLGIIQSSQSGAGIQNGRNGKFIENISVPNLIDSMSLLEANRGLCEQWQAYSWDTRKNFTWDTYFSKISEVVNEI